MINPLGRLYFGWRIHAGAFVSSLLLAGCTSYIFGLFVVPVTQEFGISRANVNLGFMAFLLGFGLLSPVVGHLIDRFSARVMMGVGGILFGIGMTIVSRTDSLLLMLLMILGPISFAMNASGTLAANTLVSRWFQNQRGKALGIVAVATSAGGFIFTPLTAMLIENYGWRDALLYVGLIATVGILLMALFVVKNRPSGTESGYEQEFSTPRRTPSAHGKTEALLPATERVWRVQELLCNRNFWLLALSIGLLYGSDMALVTSQVPHFIDTGIELPAAALIASFMTMSAIGGKLLVGALADRIDLRWIFHVIAVAHALLLILYLIMPPYWALLAMATVLGIGVGGVFPLFATMIAWLFGSKSYGTIMGVMTVLMNLLGIIALRFIGEVYDRTDSYYLGFAVFLVTITLAMVLVTFLRREPAAAEAKPEAAAYQAAVAARTSE